MIKLLTMRRTFQIKKSFPASLLIFLTLILAVLSSCGIPKETAKEETEVATPTTKVTTLENYIVATSINELFRKSTIVVIGFVTQNEDVINMARNVNNIYEPDPFLFGIGQIYELKIDRYIKGESVTKSALSIHIAQVEGVVEIQPGKTITITEIDKARQNYKYIPLNNKQVYLLFLEPLQGFKELTNYYVGVAQPWRFVVTNSNCVIPESPWEASKSFFGYQLLSELEKQMASPEVFSSSYPPPSNNIHCQPEIIKGYPIK